MPQTVSLLTARAEPAASASVAEAVRAELTEMGVVATAAGAAALLLATRLDVGQDTGSGLASLTRQMHASLAAAKSQGRPAVSRMDDLRARRERAGA